MGGVARIAVLCLLASGWSAAVAETPLAVFPINEESIAQMRKQHPLASAEVNDPVYKRKQRYQGLWLRDVLEDLGQGGHPETDVYVRFRCKDGYLPIMPLARAMGGKGLIAIRDANAPQGEDWQPLPGSGTSSTLAPSYLVWLSPPDDPEEYPWPYQVVAIELVSSSDALAGLDPDGSKPGHELFVTHCLKCHAINGIGGTYRAGTEFSLQRNGILESASPEPIHCERRQYSSWNQNAPLRLAAGERHPGNRRVSSVHGRPQEAWRRVSIKRSGDRSVTKSLRPLLWIWRDAQVSPSAQIARQRRLCRRFL